MDDFFKNIYFPYDELRKGQREFIEKVYKNIINKDRLLVCAPTGLGKTICALAPALKIAQEKELTVICLTSRQTQANQYIKTIQDISNKSKKPINYLAFIGKRSMCTHQDKHLYPASDFNEFCKKCRETGKCYYFKNTKQEQFEDTIKYIINESSNKFMSVEEFVDLAGSNKLCPYELAGKKAYQAEVIICDYSYVFSLGIKENFFGKIGRELSECILIVDEGHNLPDRIRNSYSYSLSTEMINNALKEMRDFIKGSKFDSYIQNAQYIIDELYGNKKFENKNDFLILKNDFFDKYMKTFSNNITFKEIIDKLYEIEALVKDDRIISHIGRFASFLERWHKLDEENYLRLLEKNIIKKKNKNELSLILKIRCIDPAKIASETLNKSYSSILMSATLSPIEMYRDILGIYKPQLLELDSPFEKKNQLTIAINDVTTKYNSRDNDMYKKIASHIENVLNSAPTKNSLVFFPSYDLLEKVLYYVDYHSLGRRVIKEQRYMTKEEKEKYIERFKEENDYSSKSIVLFGVTSGSFAEGLDLPSKMLEMVIVVGLPLSVPDLYVKSIIRHFDKKFRKGQMYGYIYPAMNKIIQAAGRCIRTENDKGVVVLIDSRFLWTIYAQCFPKHWKMEKGLDYKIKISNFFNE